MKKILAAFASLLLLAACADTPPPAVKQETDIGPKIDLDVLSVVVLDRSQPSGTNSPYATNNFQPTIANALRRWATDKLVAVGSTGEATVVIHDASLTYAKVPHPDSWFTREQASQYEGHADIEINVVGREGHGRVTAEATQSETLPEDPSVRERQNAYNTILNAVMNDISAKIREGAQEHLGAFTITAPVLP